MFSNSLVKDFYFINVATWKGVRDSASACASDAVFFRTNRQRNVLLATATGMSIRAEKAVAFSHGTIERFRRPLDPSTPDFGIMSEMFASGLTHAPDIGIPIFDPSLLSAETQAGVWRVLCDIAKAVTEKKGEELCTKKLSELSAKAIQMIYDSKRQRKE